MTLRPMSRMQVEETARRAARSQYLGDNTILAMVLGRYKFILDSTDRGLVPHLAFDGFWESWVTAWLTHNVRPDDIALNIGANAGYYAVMMADMAHRLVAIEPNTRHAENVRHTLHLNGLHGRSTVVEAVASDAQGQRSFLFHRDGMSMNSAVVDDVDARGEPVRSVCADDVCADATIALIDTEGHEPQVWAGMKRMRANDGFRAIIEWSPGRYKDPRGFYEQLRADGFNCAYVDFEGREMPASESIMMDGVERMVVLRRAT